MDAFIVVTIIAVAAVAAMAVALWREYACNLLLVPMPEPVEGEELHRLSADETKMLQKWVEDFVLYVVTNREEQNSALKIVAAWQEGNSIREVVQTLETVLKTLQTASRRRMRIELNAQQDACEDVSQNGKVERCVVGKLVVLRAFVRCLERELAPIC